MMIGLMFFDCILVDGRSLFVGLVRARQYTKPDTKRMRNTPSANTKNHTTMFFGYWRTTQRLEKCKHLEYLQKRRQTPTRKLQASCGTVSNALEKSKMAMSTCCHLSCSCRKSLIVVISWVSQEYPDLKPWFIFVSILFFSRCLKHQGQTIYQTGY
jgi:hypothetical protein